MGTCRQDPDGDQQQRRVQLGGRPEPDQQPGGHGPISRPGPQRAGGERHREQVPVRERVEHEQRAEGDERRIVGAPPRRTDGAGDHQQPADRQQHAAEQGEQLGSFEGRNGRFEQVGELRGQPHEPAGEHRVLHRVVAVGHGADVQPLGAPQRDDVGVADMGVLLGRLPSCHPRTAPSADSPAAASAGKAPATPAAASTSPSCGGRTAERAAHHGAGPGGGASARSAAPARSPPRPPAHPRGLAGNVRCGALAVHAADPRMRSVAAGRDRHGARRWTCRPAPDPLGPGGGEEDSQTGRSRLCSGALSAVSRWPTRRGR